MVKLKKILRKFYIIMKKYRPINNSLLIFSLNDSFITEKKKCLYMLYVKTAQNLILCYLMKLFSTCR